MRIDGVKMMKLKLLKTLNESQARWYVASEAAAMGRGGIQAMHELTGMSRPRIIRGMREIRTQKVLASDGRIRRSGGGRQPLEQHDKGITTALEKIMDENTAGRISHQEIDAMFDQAEQSPQRRELREIILSGGDPLAVPPAVLEHFALRMDRLNKTVSRRITVTIHTREPVWYPQRILGNTALHQALKKLSPASYILHVVHPREVTPELHQVMLALTELSDSRRPLMMSQHPLFRGINDNAAIITEMYDRMDSGPVVFKPYYLIHPFPDGTLPEHRLTLLESQKILRDLASAPGTRVPLLTIPTPMGKCVIGPYEQLTDRGGYYLLHTKDGVPVQYAISPHYDPAETREHIPIMPEIHRSAV